MGLDELTILSERIENVTIFKLQGNLNFLTSQKFLDTVLAGMKKGAVILDFEDLNMISSHGITALKELADASFTNKIRVLVINLSFSAKQVFQMAGLRNLFLIPENEEQAMKIASRPYR